MKRLLWLITVAAATSDNSGCVEGDGDNHLLSYTGLSSISFAPCSNIHIVNHLIFFQSPTKLENDITPSQGSCDGGGPRRAGAQWIFPRCPQCACICPGATHFVTPFKRLTLKLFEEAQLSLCLSTKRFFETCFAASSSGWRLRILKSISQRLTILKW